MTIEQAEDHLVCAERLTAKTRILLTAAKEAHEAAIEIEHQAIAIYTEMQVRADLAKEKHS